MDNLTPFVPQANQSRLEHVVRRPSSKVPQGLDTDETTETGLRGDNGSKANNVLPRVLVIEHHSTTQCKIRLWLKDLCETSAAYTGSLAVHYLKSRRHALVLVSIDQPEGYSGSGLLRAIRAIDGYEHVPVIAMAESDRSEDREDVLRQGFDACIVKPFNPMALRDPVQHLLNNREALHHEPDCFALPRHPQK